MSDQRPRPSMTPGRRLAAYATSVAFGSTAYIAMFTAVSVAARDISGSAELAGLPSAIGVLGTAAAVAVLSALMSRRGRRSGLVLGLAIASAGAAASVVAVAIDSFPLLVAGGFAVGFGNASLQLTRYAASDSIDPARRADAVGMVVWASTVGAVLGPNLVDPAGELARSIGRAPLEGGVAVAALGFVAAMVISAYAADATRPGAGVVREAGDAPLTGRLASLGSARVRIALAGMLSGQIVMNLIMTMTPVHVHEMGEPLSTVGFIISAHTLGMFALAPLTSRLIDRFGHIPVLYAGFAVLALSAVLAAVARQSELPVLTLGLFLLGYGWNLTFVAGSSLLTIGARLDERIRLQGTTDVLVWTSSAAAGAISGVILEVYGFAMLATLGGILLVLPAATIAGLSRRWTPAERSAS